MDLDDGVTLRAADDPTIKNELRRAWIADRLDERLGEFGKTHAVDVVCATWNANGKEASSLAVASSMVGVLPPPPPPPLSF